MRTFQVLGTLLIIHKITKIFGFTQLHFRYTLVHMLQLFIEDLNEKYNTLVIDKYVKTLNYW